MQDNKKGCILIADDEDDWRNKFGDCLERYGYETYYASNHDEAIKAVTGNKKYIKLAVININLNGGEIKKGWQFDWTDIVDEANANNIPVISITGSKKITNKDKYFSVMKEKAIKFKVRGVLFKDTFDKKELIEQIDENIKFENRNIYMSSCSSRNTHYQEPSPRAILMNHIANNDTKPAIEYLKNYEKIKDSTLEDDLVIVLSTYNRLYKDYNCEEITREQFNCELNKIHKTIIAIFDTAKIKTSLDME